MQHHSNSSLPGAARPVFVRKLMASVVLTSLLASCADQPWVDTSPRLPTRDRTVQGKQPNETTDVEAETRFYETPRAPVRQAPPLQVRQQVAPQPDEPGKQAAVAFNSLPLPQFIDAVYGVILKRTINIDPQIMQRKDLVSMRTGKAQAPSQLFDAAKTVLRSYGVTVQELPGLVRFVPDNADAGSLPEIRRGRALPDVPESLRPVFYLAELEHTNIVQAVSWLRTTFQSKVTIQDDSFRNAIMLSGSPQNVSAAMQAIQALDQPLMRGKLSVRISPVFWTSEELARRLTELLAAEGYYTGTQATSSAPIMLLPVPPLNSVIVFASTQRVLDHVLRWAQELDQPSQARSGSYFIYPVRNVDAADVAATLAQVMTGSSTPAAAAPAATGQAAAAPAVRSSRVVVNKATNSLIIQASAAEYQQWYSLLQELDRPARSALVTVTVAEVKLNDNEQFGFEWMVRTLNLGGDAVNISTMGAFGTKAIGGLAVQVADKLTPTMALNALASKTKARVLSNPSILTRSGESATINVGQEVPTITSQQSNADTNTSNGGVLQTIQYRNAGVTLKVKPVVHSGGRIDLDVNQEVSSVDATKAGSSALTPSISTRKLDTKLTVTDGATVVLGGLMSESGSKADSGVPYLKDIPLAGNLFKSYNDSINRTELVVMITAYAVEDDFDIQSISDTFRRRFPWSSPLYGEVPAVKEGEAGKDRSSRLSEAVVDEVPSPKVTSKRYFPKPAGAIPEAEPTQQTVPVEPGATPQPGAEDSTKPLGDRQGGGAAPAPGPVVKLPGGEAGHAVTDDALKKELLEALKGGKK